MLILCSYPLLYMYALHFVSYIMLDICKVNAHNLFDVVDINLAFAQMYLGI